MKISIQKLSLAATTATAAALTVAMPVFAQTNVNPCPSNSNQFFKICSLNAANIGFVINTAVSTILVVAVIIALFFLILGAVRWITSGGDKAKVESARNTIIAAIIGIVIAFLAYFILSLVLSLFGLNLSNLQLPKFVN